MQGLFILGPALLLLAAVLLVSLLDRRAAVARRRARRPDWLYGQNGRADRRSW